MFEPECVPELMQTSQVHDGVAKERILSGSPSDLLTECIRIGPDIDSCAAAAIDDYRSHLAVQAKRRGHPIHA
jgi:hypothetical protein